VHGALLLLCTCTLASLAHLNVHFEHTQVRKAVHSGTAVAVVVAVDIQETSLRAGQPGAEVAETCQLAEARAIPVVFALSRLGLGSIFGASKRMSGEELSRWAQDKRRTIKAGAWIVFLNWKTMGATGNGCISEQAPFSR
jgi:ribosomal protein L7Ae-like RNA K-turn-binding protein